MSFNNNEAIILMYENTSEALTEIATHIEKYNLNIAQAIQVLRNCAIQLEAQSKVVEIREDLNSGKL